MHDSFAFGIRRGVQGAAARPLGVSRSDNAGAHLTWARAAPSRRICITQRGVGVEQSTQHRLRRPSRRVAAASGVDALSGGAAYWTPRVNSTPTLPSPTPCLKRLRPEFPVPEQACRSGVRAACTRTLDRERLRIDAAALDIMALFRAPVMHSGADGRAPVKLAVRSNKPGGRAVSFGPVGVHTAQRISKALGGAGAVTQAVDPEPAAGQAESAAAR